MNFFIQKLSLLVLGSLLTINLSFGQKSSDYKPEKFSDKLFFGGALGLTVGDITQIDIIPVAGIWVIPQWSLGIGGRYSFYSHRGYFIGGPSESYRTHIWGGSVFTQILPIVDFSEILPIPVHGGIMFHGEFERLYLDRRLIDPFTSSDSRKTWVDLCLVGVGYRQRLGERAAINILLLWEVSNSSYSPYPQSPMIRVNITL
jgi:hypothetical protein